MIRSTLTSSANGGPFLQATMDRSGVCHDASRAFRVGERTETNFGIFRLYWSVVQLYGDGMQLPWSQPSQPSNFADLLFKNINPEL